MTPKAQVAAFFAKFTPEVAAMGKTALKKMQARYPGANQMVYDNYNFFVIGFSPTDRPSDAIFSLAMSANGVGLCFLQAGPKIPDPKKLLKGVGKQVRSIHLESAEDLDHPAVKTLMTEVLKLARVPFPKTGKGKVIIRAISAKQRPRRKTS